MTATNGPDPSFQPTPIDTSKVDVPADVLGSVETLAENTHNVWARQRQNDGWHVGPKRDEDSKSHPSLIPYGQLSDAEKKYDRLTSLETIKVLLALGYRIEKPVASASAPSAAGSGTLPAGQFDDALTWCHTHLIPAWERADKKALTHKSIHRYLTLTVAVMGTLAVLFAIGELTRLIPGSWLGWGEFVAIVCAFVAVAAGLIAAFDKKWLVHRHRAERLKLLQHHFLTHPVVLGDKNSERQKLFDGLSGKVGEFDKVTAATLRAWAREPTIPGDDSLPIVGQSASNLRSLVDYYRRNRLDPELRFLEERARQDLTWERHTRRLPSVFFFGSVVAALIHFVYEVLTREPGNAASKNSFDVDPINAICLMIAAGLPVLGTGIRALRSAFEFARNGSRYIATHAALRQLADRLAKSDRDASILRDLWFCEYILESEHREWLRLMSEAEWFG